METTGYPEKAMISIIVPCFNSERFIDRTLTALLREADDINDVEIILVDNNSTDSTPLKLQKYANEYKQIKFVRCTKGQGVNIARNEGVNSSCGNFLLFTDHDDEVLPGWLAAYRTAFLNNARLVTGSYYVMTSEKRLISSQQQPVSLLWNLPWGLGSNSGIARSDFVAIRGFDESWQGGGDDADFFWRAQLSGLPLTFVNEARLIHYTRESNKNTAKQYFDYGRSNVQLYLRFRDYGMPRSSTFRSFLVFVISAFDFILSPFKIGSTERSVQRLATHSGRLVESLRLRTIYL